MSDTILSNLDISRDFLEVFHSNLSVAKNLDHDYEKNFGNQVGFEGQKIGPTLQIREPIMTTVRSGWAMQTQEITETYKPLTIDTVRGVDLHFYDSDMALSIDEFEPRYVDVPAKRLASEVDSISGAFVAKNTANCVAASALAVPTTIDTYLLAAERLKTALVPIDSPLNVVIDPISERKIVNGLAGQYNPQQTISDIFMKGQIAKAAGLDWYMSQVLPSITTGSLSNTSPVGNALTVTDANSTASLTYTAGVSGGTLAAGQTFTIAGMYDVNYETKATLSTLKQFTVVSSTPSTTTGTIVFYPAPIATGATQNVSTVTVSGQAIVFGAIDQTTSIPTTASTVYQQSLVFHPKSFAFASVPLRMPENVMGATVSVDNFNMRFLRGFDMTNSRYLSRMDIFFGLAELRRGWACKILHV